jgi:chromatin modification-related protein EAF6
MTENAPPGVGGAPGVAGNNPGAAAGIPYYEKQRQHLRDMIARKRALEKRLVSSSSTPHCSSCRGVATHPLPGSKERAVY